MKVQLSITGLAIIIASITHIAGASLTSYESAELPNPINGRNLAESLLLMMEEKSEASTSIARGDDKASEVDMQPTLQVNNHEDQHNMKDESVLEKSPASPALSSSSTQDAETKGESSDSNNESEKEKVLQIDPSSIDSTHFLPIADLSLQKEQSEEILTIDPIENSHHLNPLQNGSMLPDETSNAGEQMDKLSEKSSSDPDTADLVHSGFDSVPDQTLSYGETDATVNVGKAEEFSSRLPDSEKIDFGDEGEDQKAIRETFLSSGESVSVDDVKYPKETDATAIDAKAEESPSGLPDSNPIEEYDYLDKGEDEAPETDIFDVTTVSEHGAEQQVFATPETGAKLETENSPPKIRSTPSSEGRPVPPPKKKPAVSNPKTSSNQITEPIDEQKRTEAPLPLSCPFSYTASNNPTNLAECPFSQKPRPSHESHDKHLLQSETISSSKMPRPASPQEDPSQQLYMIFVNEHVNSSPVQKRRISPRQPLPTSLLFPDIVQVDASNIKSPSEVEPIPNTLASTKTPLPCSNALFQEPALEHTRVPSMNAPNSAYKTSEASRARKEKFGKSVPQKQDAEWFMNFMKTSPPSADSRKSLSPKQVRKQDIKWFKNFLKPSRHSARSHCRNPFNFYGDAERLVYELPIKK